MRFGFDRHGIIGHDTRLRSLDDQHVLSDLERRGVLLGNRHHVAILLADDIFEAERVLRAMADDVADQTTGHRTPERTQCADRAGAGLRSGNAAGCGAGRRANGRIGADRDCADADNDARLDLVGLLDDVACIGVGGIIRSTGRQNASQRQQPDKANTPPIADYTPQLMSPHPEPEPCV